MLYPAGRSGRDGLRCPDVAVSRAAQLLLDSGRLDAPEPLGDVEHEPLRVAAPDLLVLLGVEVKLDPHGGSVPALPGDLHAPHQTTLLVPPDDLVAVRGIRVNLGEIAPGELLGRLVAEHLDQRAVDREESAVRLRLVDADRSEVEDVPVFVLRDLQLLFGT